MKEISIFILLSLFFAINSYGQAESPVKWDVSAEVGDKVVTITYAATIDKGWYVYSQHLESDLGPVPTSVNIEDESIKAIGKIEEEGNKKEGFDKYFSMNIVKYADKLTLVQKIERTSDLKNVKGYVEFMTCNDSQCLPPTEIDFDIAIN